jgi:hypothetical protein
LLSCFRECAFSSDAAFNREVTYKGINWTQKAELSQGNPTKKRQTIIASYSVMTKIKNSKPASAKGDEGKQL